MRKNKHASALIALLALATLAVPTDAAAAPAAPRGYLQALFFLRHPAGLNRFVAAVSDPTSSRYRRYASVETVVRRFGAPPGTAGRRSGGWPVEGCAAR